MSVYKDLFKDTVSNMQEDYIYPQENGSHCDCEFVAMNNENCSIKFISTNKFSFNVSNYSIKELANKNHNFELSKSDYTILNLDYKMSGVGSNSCGPEVFPEYRLDEKEFSFSFTAIIE